MPLVSLPLPLVDPVVAPLTARRSEVLRLLRASSAPLGVQDVAEQLGLHRNTARFHLDGLVDDGLIERSAEARDEPGRPRLLYTARSFDAGGVRSYQFLAEMLTGLVSSVVPDPAATAMVAGREWGRHLTEKVPPSRRLTTAEVVERLRSLLGSIGFDPQLAGEPEAPELHLRHCPFREVAERHQNVVCALHLGLLRGALEEMRAPLAADLEPFVQPSLCVSRLTQARAPAARRPRKPPPKR